MNWRNVISLSAATALGFAFLSGSAIAQQRSLKDQLVGTWTAVSWEQTYKDGKKSQRFGVNPKGVQIFDANGRFFMTLIRPDLPKVASNNPETATPDESKAIAAGSISYFGTYTVNEADKSFTLHVEASSYPNVVGDQKRTITSLTADELKYGNPVSTSGGQIQYVFKRAK